MITMKDIGKTVQKYAPKAVPVVIGIAMSVLVTVAPVYGAGSKSQSGYEITKAEAGVIYTYSQTQKLVNKEGKNIDEEKSSIDNLIDGVNKQDFKDYLTNMIFNDATKSVTYLFSDPSADKLVDGAITIKVNEAQYEKLQKYAGADTEQAPKGNAIADVNQDITDIMTPGTTNVQTTELPNSTQKKWYKTKQAKNVGKVVGYAAGAFGLYKLGEAVFGGKDNPAPTPAVPVTTPSTTPVVITPAPNTTDTPGINNQAGNVDHTPWMSNFFKDKKK